MATSGNDAVLFDIDGTLIDSTYHHAVAWHRAFRAEGVPVPIWKVHRTIGMGGDKLVAHVTSEQVEEEKGDSLRDTWKEMYAEILAEVAPLAGATELVKKLHGQGYAIALPSSGDREFAEKHIEDLDITDEVALLTTSDDAEESKPESDILTVTLRELGAERGVMVGDTPYDVEAAKGIGLECIGVLTGGFSKAELEGAGASLVVESLEDLLDLDWSTHLREPTLEEDD
jgi:HAD superfamily hydrolase (TIGR01549 family)